MKDWPSKARGTTFRDSTNTSRLKGRRDLAILCVLLDTGLRASEVANLLMFHTDLENHTIAALTKGGEWEAKALSPYTTSCLASWYGLRELIAKPNEKTVFVSVGGKRPGTSMTRCGIKSLVKSWGEKARIDGLTPHKLRHTFATLATKLGSPEAITMKQGGWKDQRVFRRYIQDIAPKDFVPYSPLMAAMEIPPYHR